MSEQDQDKDKPKSEKDGDKERAAAPAPTRRQMNIPAPTTEGPPAWAKMPPDLPVPRGRTVYYMLCRAHLTDAPHRGDRALVLWSLSDGDEKAAINRSMQDDNRITRELAKQMVRAIDGKVPDWSGAPGPANIDVFWDEVGGRYRSQLIRVCNQIHSLNEQEQVDFFENCFAARTAG